jgi:N-acetylglutamate synthase-like GNAT family acetyltransferase
MEVMNLRGNPQYKESAIDYFQKIWATDESKPVYEDCISRSLVTESPLPIWYLLLENDKIIGCAGLVTNDFISCMDLWPWLCALYIEEEYRGNAYGSLLIARLKQDAAKAGFTTLYLSTGHVGYYEKYGFKYVCTGYHPWGESSRVYECQLNLRLIG